MTEQNDNTIEIAGQLSYGDQENVDFYATPDQSGGLQYTGAGPNDQEAMYPDNASAGYDAGNYGASDPQQ